MVTLSKTQLLSLSFLLSCSYLAKPTLATDGKYKDVASISLTSSTSPTDQLRQEDKVWPSQQYRMRLHEAQKDQEALYQKMIITLTAKEDVVKKIHHQVKGIQKKGLPKSFKNLLQQIRWVEPYEMFDPIQLGDLIAQYNPDNLAPLTKIIDHLKQLNKEWRDLSGNTANSLLLALNQTLWYQEEWNDLVRQIKDDSLTGAHIYKWVSNFIKTLQVLETFHINLANCSSLLPQDRECLAVIDQTLTSYFHSKTAILWKFIRLFFNALPEYDHLPKNFFLRSNPYGWINYLRYLADMWPTSEIWQQKELRAIAHQAENLVLKIQNKDKLTSGDKKNLEVFWGENGRKFWELLKNSIKNLPEYSNGLLENLYPGASALPRIDTDIKLLAFLGILGLYNKPLVIPEDLALEFEEVFTPAPNWPEKIKEIKATLKPFANVYGIVESLISFQGHYEGFTRKYQPNFGKTYDCFISDASMTLPDGRQLNMPQSIACQVFPNLHLPLYHWLDALVQSNSVSIPPIQCLHFPEMDIGAEYAWHSLQNLWGLPRLPFTLGFFKNIFVHRVATNKTVEFGSRLDIRNMDRFTDNASKINYQREALVEEFLKAPSQRRVRSESAFAVMQEQFTGISLQAFLEDVAKGIRLFDQIDHNSVFRQALFTMLTQSFAPPENWGLVNQNGKLVLVRIHDGIHRSAFLHPTVKLVNTHARTFKQIITDYNILYFLPFADEEIPPQVKEEFLSHDILLILSLWMTELTKMQPYFDTCRQKEKGAAFPSSKEIQQQEAEGLTIRFYSGMLKKLIENFQAMQRHLPHSGTYLQLLNKLRSAEFQHCNDFFQQNESAIREQEATLFFQNVLPPIIQNTGWALEKDTFQQEAQGCLQKISSNSHLSIEDAIHQITLDEIKYFFLSIYAKTKNRDFAKAHVILKSWKDAIAQKEKATSLNKKAVPEQWVQGIGILEELVSVANIRDKTPDQQIEILSLLLELLPDIQWENPIETEVETPVKPQSPIEILQDIQSNPGTPKAVRAISPNLVTASLDDRSLQDQNEIVSLMITPVLIPGEPSPKLQPKHSRKKNVTNTIDPSKIHRSWENLVRQIVSSSKLSFLKKFLAISPRLREFFDQSVRNIYFSEGENEPSQKFRNPNTLFQEAWNRCLGFPTLEDAELKEMLIREEYKSWQSVAPTLSNNITPEEVAGQLFRLLFQGSLRPTPEESFFLNALCDLFLLPRYAGLDGLPEELRPMAAYLESSGFGCDLSKRQYLGRRKSSHSGPCSQNTEDGHFYAVGGWSARCVELFQSPKIIPDAVRQIIMSLDAPLLCLHWLGLLQKQGIKLEFYPWFIPTLLENIPQMQKLTATHPHLTFPQAMEILWPELFAIYHQKFKEGQKNSPKSVCKHIESHIESCWDLAIVDLKGELDWIPKGQSKTLGNILEESSDKQADYRSQPSLSIPDAATEVISHSISQIDESERGKVMLKYGTQLHIDGKKVPPKLTWVQLCLIIPQSSLDVQKAAIALYLGCPVDGIQITDDSLKISGIIKTEIGNLFKLIFEWLRLTDMKLVVEMDKNINTEKKIDKITSLDLSNNQILSIQELAIHLGKFMNLKKLVLNDNPVYDPSKLRLFPNLTQIELLRTYVPALDNFNVRFRFQKGKIAINGDEVVPPSVYGLSAEDVKGIVNYYFEQLTHCWSYSIAKIVNSNDCYLTHSDIIPTIMLQLSQNFWREALDLAREQKIRRFSNQKDEQNNLFLNFLGSLEENLGEENKLWFNLFSNGEFTDVMQAKEALLKLIFAWKYDLPGNVVPDDLAWCKKRQSYSLRQLHLGRANAQTHLDILAKYWEMMNASNTTPIAYLVYLDVMALAANQLAEKFWEEGLSWGQKNKTLLKVFLKLADEQSASPSTYPLEESEEEYYVPPQERHVSFTLPDEQPQAPQVTFPSLNALKLAFAWRYGLPPGTQRDSLSFAPLSSLQYPFNMDNPYCLTNLVISRANLSQSSLEFLPNFSGVYSPKLCRSPTASPKSNRSTAISTTSSQEESLSSTMGSPKASRSPKKATQKEIRLYSVNDDIYFKSWGQKEQKVTQKDLGAGFSNLKRCAQQRKWQLSSEYDTQDLLKFTLLHQHTFSGLTTLGLSHCQLTTTAFVPKCNNLTDLNVSHNHLKDLWGLFDSALKFPLESLDVSHNRIKITPESWEKLQKPISSIKEIDMSHNQISIIPIMLTSSVKKSGKQENAQEEKNTCFKITHNNIKIEDIHQFYDIKFFVKRSAKDRRSIIPQKNNQHPIHIFQMDSLSTDQVKMFWLLKEFLTECKEETFPPSIFPKFVHYWSNINKKLFFQIYQSTSPKRLMKAPWDISDYDSPIVEKLRSLTTETNLSIDDRREIISLIAHYNPDYLNTAHLQVTPQNNQR